MYWKATSKPEVEDLKTICQVTGGGLIECIVSYVGHPTPHGSASPTICLNILAKALLMSMNSILFA